MEALDKLDKRVRNIGLLLIITAIILLLIWLIDYLISPKTASPLLMSIGIALLLGGILLVTRIQYIIWIKKRF
ncbi:MAG: hypothetical protein ACFFB0_19740 [Promethearchaeota archaeon]